MTFNGIHTFFRGMSLCEFKRDSSDFKWGPLILNGMSLYEFKGDPSIPTKPASNKKKKTHTHTHKIPGDQTLYVIRHWGRCWTNYPFEI